MDRQKIGSAAIALRQVCDVISTFAAADVDEGLGLDLMLDELHHVQLLTLELTKLMTEAETANADDSAFFAGELVSKKPDEHDTTGIETTEEEGDK